MQGIADARYGKYKEATINFGMVAVDFIPVGKLAKMAGGGLLSRVIKKADEVAEVVPNQADEVVEAVARNVDEVAVSSQNLTRSQIKSISSLKNQIEKHEVKLAEYIQDPMKFDNKGFLKNAPNDAVRQKIIQARINHLQREIEAFRGNIQKIINTRMK